jgi:tetratricopeptide (TPR) repeat protein
LAVIIGIALACFGIRQALASLAMVPSGPTVETLRLLKDVSKEDLERLVDNENRALALLDSPRDWSNLGLALSLQGEAAADKSQRSERLLQADQALRQSLSLAPANPYVWLRLALVRQANGGEPKDVLAPWRMSIVTGPSEDRLWKARIRMGVDYWPNLTEFDRQTVFADVRRAWTKDWTDVMSIATNPFTINVIRAALLTDFAEYTNFEKELAARQRP